MKFSIFGAGSWGTALAQVLTDNGHDVLMYHYNQEITNDINCNHMNSKYFPGFILNRNIVCTNDLKCAIDYSTNIILCIPSRKVEDLLNKLIPLMENKKYSILNTIKGFVGENNELMIPYLRKKIPSKLLESVSSILGPSHAEEVISKELTCICIVNKDIDISEKWQRIFANNYFRVYTIKDEIGAEICASYKNAIAIGSGIAAGLGYGDNARAALITRGLAEIMKFGMFFGGELKTFLGLTGVGDLVVTCNSKHSRNFSFGFLVGKYNDPKIALKEFDKTVEGYKTVKALYNISINNNLDSPIISALYKVLYDGHDLENEITFLMTRPLKREF